MKKVTIYQDGKTVIITTHGDYISNVEKITANQIRIELEKI